MLADVAKGVSMAILFVVSALLSSLAIMLFQTGTLSPTTSRPSPFRHLVLDLVNCFSGGVLLSACFLHLFPHGRQELNEYITLVYQETQCPFFELGVGIGLLLVAFVEKLSIGLLAPGSKNLGGRHSSVVHAETCSETAPDATLPNTTKETTSSRCDSCCSNGRMSDTTLAPAVRRPSILVNAAEQHCLPATEEENATASFHLASHPYSVSQYLKSKHCSKGMLLEPQSGDLAPGRVDRLPPTPSLLTQTSLDHLKYAEQPQLAEPNTEMSTVSIEGTSSQQTSTDPLATRPSVVAFTLPSSSQTVSLQASRDSSFEPTLQFRGSVIEKRPTRRVSSTKRLSWDKEGEVKYSTYHPEPLVCGMCCGAENLNASNTEPVPSNIPVVRFKSSNILIHEYSRVDLELDSFNNQDSTAASENEMSQGRACLLSIALSFQMMFDGLAIGLQKHAPDVFAILAAIGAHKAVVTFCLGLELAAATPGNVIRPMVFMTAFAIISPLGIMVGVGITSTAVDGRLLVSSVLLSVATGIFLYITFFQILGPHLAHHHHHQLPLITAHLAQERLIREHDRAGLWLKHHELADQELQQEQSSNSQPKTPETDSYNWLQQQQQQQQDYVVVPFDTTNNDQSNNRCNTSNQSNHRCNTNNRNNHRCNNDKQSNSICQTDNKDDGGRNTNNESNHHENANKESNHRENTNNDSNRGNTSNQSNCGNTSNQSNHRGNTSNQSNHRGNTSNQSKNRGNTSNQSKNRGNISNQSNHRGNNSNQSNHRGNNSNQSNHRGNTSNQGNHRGNASNRSNHRGNTSNQSNHRANPSNQSNHRGNTNKHGDCNQNRTESQTHVVFKVDKEEDLLSQPHQDNDPMLDYGYEFNTSMDLLKVLVTALGFAIMSIGIILGDNHQWGYKHN